MNSVAIEKAIVSLIGHMTNFDITRLAWLLVERDKKKAIALADAVFIANQMNEDNQ